MPDTQISDETVERALAAYRAESRDVGANRICMRAALSAALPGHVVGWRTIDSAKDKDDSNAG